MNLRRLCVYLCDEFMPSSSDVTSSESQQTSRKIAFIEQQLKDFLDNLAKSQIPEIKKINDGSIEHVLSKYK